MLDYSIGKRCQYSICKQQDFLPFTCQLCGGAYCTEHRTPEGHECNKLAIKKQAIICPICNKGISYSSNEDENYVWEKHFRTECTQEQQSKKMCPACKVKLTPLNSVQCKSCGIDVCLKHRHQDDHKCGVQEAFKYKQVQIPKNQILEKQQKIQQEKVPRQEESNNQGQEVCPVCGKKFPYIMQLIRHSEIHCT